MRINNIKINILRFNKIIIMFLIECKLIHQINSQSNKKEIKLTCKADINTVSAAVGSILAYRCPVGCGSIESIPVYNGKENRFSEHSSICRSAAYMGLTKDEEETVV